MSRIALALALSALPAAALSQSASPCATFAEANGIPAPPDSLTDQAALLALTKAMLPINFDIDLMANLPGGDAMPMPEIRAAGGCSLREMAMLTANFAAIDTAQPAADPASVAGTWLSDDIFLAVAGVVVPGQEVLVIGAPLPASDGAPALTMEPPPGSLPVSQYWYHGFTPPNASVWNEKNEYYGLIVSGHLSPDGSGGFADSPAAPSLRYAGITIIPERTDDLFLKGRLNIFQRDVGLALATGTQAADTLVVTYDAPIPMQRVWAERKRTYHRVAAGSPDAALRMVRGMGLPNMPYSGCLTRLISAEDPALSATIAPMTLAEFDAAQRAYDRWDLDKIAYMDVFRSGGEDDALKQKFMDGMEGNTQFSKQARDVGKAIAQANLCPPPPSIFGLL